MIMRKSVAMTGRPVRSFAPAGRISLKCDVTFGLREDRGAAPSFDKAPGRTRNIQHSSSRCVSDSMYVC